MIFAQALKLRRMLQISSNLVWLSQPRSLQPLQLWGLGSAFVVTLFPHPRLPVDHAHSRVRMVQSGPARVAHGILIASGSVAAAQRHELGHVSTVQALCKAASHGFGLIARHAARTPQLGTAVIATLTQPITRKSTRHRRLL